MTAARRTILFSGMIAGDPFQGGATWAILQYVLGLRQLGHDVYFVEPVQTISLRPTGTTLADSVNASYFARVVRDFGLQDRAALLLTGSTQTLGLPYEQLVEIARRADLLINISGMLADPTLIGSIPIRAYLDLDPAFVQLWQAAEGIDMRFAAHTHFITVGRNIGETNCAVPTCGRGWIKTFPPVVLREWPAVGPDEPCDSEALTTIANWRGYGSIHHQGIHYGQKAHSLRPLIELPRQTAQPFALALAIDPGETNDLKALRDNRWSLIDPQIVTRTPAAYRNFIQHSKGEFGIAKSGYVVSNSGWFSDRSACYLASGRPVIAQDTGWSRTLSTGEGLWSFRDRAHVLECIDAMNKDYPFHCRAARQIAERFFDSDHVLARLIDTLEAS